MQKDFQDELEDLDQKGRKMAEDLAGLEDSIRKRLRKQYWDKQPERPPGPTGSIADQIRWAGKRVGTWNPKYSNYELSKILWRHVRDDEYGEDALAVVFRIFKRSEEGTVTLTPQEVKVLVQPMLAYMMKPFQGFSLTGLKDWWRRRRMKRQGWLREAIAYDLAARYAQELGRHELHMDYSNFRGLDEYPPKQPKALEGHPYRGGPV